MLQTLGLGVLLLCAQAPSRSELLDQILDAPNTTTAAEFDALARPGDFEAMTALRRCLAAVTSPSITARLVPAFRNFGGHEVRLMEALIALDDLAWDRSNPQLSAPLAVREERERLRLSEGNGGVPLVATRTLLELGPKAVPFLEELFQEHKSNNVREIAFAALVPGLVEAGTEDDFELLLEHFHPGASGTLTKGVEALSSFDPDKTTKPLMKAVEDRRRDDDVRAMAMAALARSPGKKVDKFVVKQLKSRARLVQIAAVEALLARGMMGHEKELRRLLASSTSHSPRLLHAAFVALAATLHAAGETGELEELLFEAADDKAFERRIGAAENLSRLRSAQANATLIELLTDLDAGVRLAAMDAVVEARLRPAIPILIGRLENDSLRLRTRAREGLELLTGLDLGSGPSWRLWWEAEATSFQLPTRSTAEASRAARQAAARDIETHTPPTFFDVPLSSDRVVFVLDVSGSMDGGSGQAKTRLERTRTELMRSMRTLPETARVNLILFSAAAVAWSPHVIKLDTTAREAFESFLFGTRFGGDGTNIHAGLMLALDDPNCEEVILLSDGEDGNWERILRDVRERLELRDCTISTVSASGYSESLRRLAEAGGGEYRQL
jgi:HEAT repeat protein